MAMTIHLFKQPATHKQTLVHYDNLSYLRASNTDLSTGVRSDLLSLAENCHLGARKGKTYRSISRSTEW